MILPGLALLALLGAGDDRVAERLVAQLGASRYAQREAAAHELEAQGRRALPTLRLALDDKDPEVRARAAVLVDRIETGLLVRPTMLKLDYQNRPLPEVVRDLADQSHVALALFPENNPAFAARRVNLKRAEPVPFWEAIDLLCREADLQRPSVMHGVGPGGKPFAMALTAGSAGPAPPTSDSGPFRTQLTGVHHHRDRNFVAGQPMFAGGVQHFAGAGALNPPADRGQALDNFYADLQVMAEPRMTIIPNGQVKLVEALDDRGNSLLPPASAAAPGVPRPSGFNGYTPVGTATLTLLTNLKFPERPGRLIKHLKGVLPVVASARKDDPTVIPLADSKGKSFKAGDFTLVLNDLRADPNNPRQTLIDLTLRPNLGTTEPGGAMRIMQDLNVRTANPANSPFEIIDAQGRPYPQWVPVRHMFSQDETQMTIALSPQGKLGPPAQLRYYETQRASTEITFEFRDVEMP